MTKFIKLLKMTNIYDISNDIILIFVGCLVSAILLASTHKLSYIELFPDFINTASFIAFMLNQSKLNKCVISLFKDNISVKFTSQIWRYYVLLHKYSATYCFKQGK